MARATGSCSSATRGPDDWALGDAVETHLTRCAQWSGAVSPSRHRPRHGLERGRRRVATPPLTLVAGRPCGSGSTQATSSSCARLRPPPAVGRCRPRCRDGGLSRAMIDLDRETASSWWSLPWPGWPGRIGVWPAGPGPRVTEPRPTNFDVALLLLRPAAVLRHPVPIGAVAAWSSPGSAAGRRWLLPALAFAPGRPRARRLIPAPPHRLRSPRCGPALVVSTGDGTTYPARWSSLSSAAALLAAALVARTRHVSSWHHPAHQLHSLLGGLLMTAHPHSHHRRTGRMRKTYGSTTALPTCSTSA